MRAQVLAFLFLLGVASFPGIAPAQERPGPERSDTVQGRPTQEMEHGQAMEHQQAMQQQIDAMMPMMGSMFQNLTQSTTAALADPQTAQNLAKFVRNYYEALVAEGFTREEALRIVTSVGFPALPSL